MNRFLSACVAVISIFISTISIAAGKYNSVEEFVADQKVIRVAMDHAPGFGNQAATVNMMNRLWQMNFHGTYEFIYPNEEHDKVISLFNLPKDLPVIYNYEDSKKHKIIFMQESAYIDRLVHNQVEPVTLGISGAHDSDFDDGCYMVPACESHADNFAEFTNTSVFVMLQPWFRGPDLDKYFKSGEHGKDIGHEINPPGRYWVFPVANLENAKDYLANDPNGRELLAKKPALKILIDGMEKQNFNVLPVYGYNFQKAYNRPQPDHSDYLFPLNILEVITGARYAQINGNETAHKPLIIPVYYNYDEELHDLAQLMQSDNWGKYENHGAPQMRAALKTLGLTKSGALQFASLADVDASKKIQALRPDQILIISMGPLPKVVFDGTYTHTGDNIWPQMREGEGSLSVLLLGGRPHFRCFTPYDDEDDIADMRWEPGFDLIKDAALKQRLELFYGKEGFCAHDIWNRNATIYKLVGDEIMEANDPNSALSHYFSDMLTDTAKPEFDRIHRGLEEALKVVEKAVAATSAH